MAKKAKAPTVVNPYKKGSAKAEIYATFMDVGGGEKGMDAAHKKAKALDIKPGTVKSWGSMWLRGATKPNSKADDKPKASKKAKGGDDMRSGYEPHFRFTSRAAADKAHEATCTRNGLRPHALHVIEDQGRFAVVPAMYKPGGPVPTFEKGDIVYDLLIANSKARVVDPGPEQTVVKYLSPPAKGFTRPDVDCVINRFLIKVTEAKKAERAAKRERL